MSSRCHKFFLGLPVIKPFHGFGPASQQCFCCKLRAPYPPSTIHTTVLLWLQTFLQSFHSEKHFNETGTILWVLLRSWVIILERFYPFSSILNRNSLRPSRMKSPSKRWLLRNAVSIQAFFWQHLSVGMSGAFNQLFLPEPFPSTGSCPWYF